MWETLVADRAGRAGRAGSYGAHAKCLVASA
jgi:hypothetical protein